MKIIGVTGGIGSGKSTVSRILSDLGAKVLDADRIAREVVKKGGEALDELKMTFGNEILDSMGELDRKKLAAIVFSDAEKLKTLNRITHKYVASKIKNEVHRLRKEGKTEIVVIDVPLPVKEGFRDVADVIWTVTADRETRIKRVMARSSVTREEVERRMNAQYSEDSYVSLADIVIKNDGSIEDLEKKVAKLYVEAKSNRTV